MKWFPTHRRCKRRGTSAGGGYTTAADLMKFADALMSNKLLKAETFAEATRAQFTTGAYGFRFQIGPPDEARTYGHGGSAPGMNAMLGCIRSRASR